MIVVRTGLKVPLAIHVDAGQDDQNGNRAPFTWLQRLCSPRGFCAHSEID